MIPASASSRRSPGDRPPLTARLGWALFASLLLGAPLLLGGAPGWAPGLLAGWAAVALLLSPRIPASQPLTRGEAGAVLATVLAAAWTALQALPLPGLPAREAAVEAWRLLGEAPPPPTLSLDPASTAEHLVVALGAAATMLSAVSWIRAGRRAALLRVLALSGVLVAVVGLGHLAAGAERLYGLYAPRFARPTLLNPLLNPNHMAGFLAAGATLSAGLALGSRRRSERLAWAMAALVQAGVSLAGLSRAGTAALLAGGLLLGGWVRRRRAPRSRKGLLVMAAGALLVAAAGWVLLGPLLEQLRPQEPGQEGKLRVWASALAIVMGHPLVGVGRGAFGAASAALHEGPFAIRSPESLPLQWAAEWGLPASALLMALFGRPLLRAARRARSVEGKAAVAGIAVLLLHSLADFVLELPAVALWGSAAYAAAIGGRREGREDAAPRDGLRRFREAWSRPALSWVVTAVALLAAVGLGPRLPGWRLQRMTDRLSEALREGHHARFEATLREGLRLHPVEPALLVLGAEHAVVTGSPQAPQWVRLALRRARGWAQAWLLEAQLAWRQGRVERAIEALAEAARRDPALTGRVAATLARSTELTPEMVLEVGRRARGAEKAFLTQMVRDLDARPVLAAVLDERLLRLDPYHREALVRTARRWIAAGAPEEAVRVLERGAARPDAPVSLLLALSEAYEAAGRPRAAFRAARAATERAPQNARAWRLLAATAARLGLVEEVEAALASYRGLSRGSPRKLAEAYRFEAHLEHRLGRHSAEVRALLEADRLQPDDEWLDGALAAARARREDQGLLLLLRQRLCRRRPERCPPLNAVPTDGNHARRPEAPRRR